MKATKWTTMGIALAMLIQHGVHVSVAFGQKMYWAEIQSDSIKRANLDGSNVEELVSGLADPLGIALDAAAGKMYWTDTGFGSITRANLDGSDVEDLVTTGGPGLNRHRPRPNWAQDVLG